MNIIFGAGSKLPANTRLTNGYTLFDWVMRNNCFPAFWVRPMLGDTPIIQEERDFLLKKDCKIALTVSDLSEETVSGINGKKDALRAIEEAKKLRIPPNEGIAIFAEIDDNWSVNHTWMLGFARVLLINGYKPGFIGNTDSSKNFNFDRQCSHYAESSNYADYFEAAFCATQPKLKEEPEEWTPFCPSQLKQDNMKLWFCDEMNFGEIKASKVYAKDEKVLECMW